jgi:O-antigen/teichoic acid export membrane protein
MNKSSPSTGQSSRLGSGAVWSILDNLAQQALSFVVFLVLARLVSPVEFGQIAIAHVIVTFVRMTVFDAITHPVARSESPTDALYSWALGLCVMSALVMAALMLAGASMASRLYAHPELAQVISWMSLVVVAIGTAAVYEARLIRQMDFRPLAIRSIVSVSVGGCVGIVLALRGAGVMALVAQQVVTSCLALGLLVAQARWLPSLSIKGITGRGIAKQGIPWRDFLPNSSRVSMTGLFSFLASQGDTVLVSVFMGSYATGIYSFAKRLASAIYLVIGSSLLKLAIPAFADAGTGPVALRAAYIRIVGTSIFMMAPLLAGLSLLAQPMITLFFGDAWGPATPIVALLCALYILLAVNQINDYLMFAIGSRTVPMQRGLVQTVLALLLGWAGSAWGLPWTAAGFVLAGLLVWPWPQAIANKSMRVDFLDLAFALKAPLLATAAMSVFVWIALHQMRLTAITLIALVACGAAVFLLSHRLVIYMSPSSHDALKDLVQRRRPAPV